MNFGWRGVVLAIAVLPCALASGAPAVRATPTPSPSFDFPPVGVSPPVASSPSPGANESVSPASETAPSPQASATPLTSPSPRHTRGIPSPHRSSRVPIVPVVPHGPSATPTIGPLKELTQLKWLAGTWTARSRRPNVPQTTDRSRDVSTYVFAPTMGGRWMFGSDGKARDLLYFSYDEPAAQWVLVRIRPSPSYAVLTSSSGWQNRRLTFDSSQARLDGRDEHLRASLIGLGPGVFTLYEELQQSDGTWAPAGELDFTKTR